VIATAFCLRDVATLRRVEVSVYTSCLGGNNWRFPHRTLRTTNSIIRGPPIGVFNGLLTSTTGGCTAANATNYLVYAWWSFCSFYMRHKEVSGLSLRRSMERTKRTCFVASMIARSHTCRLLPMEWSEGHSLLEKSQHEGRALAFDSSGCDNNTTHAWNFSANQVLLASHGSFGHSY
jgi:hypothetical protein